MGCLGTDSILYNRYPLLYTQITIKRLPSDGVNK